MSHLSLFATLVDFAGSAIVAVAAMKCLWAFGRIGGASSQIDSLRSNLAAGLVLALSFKTGAGVIRTITVASWHQFVSLLFIVGLRFFLGYALKAQLARWKMQADGSNPGFGHC